MNFISVRQAAEKFKISERRIQKLCELNRIKGCKMLSNVWLIPENAKKPSDDRISYIPKNKDFLKLSELCNSLSISLATGRNWIKLGKLTPNYTKDNIPYFHKDYVDSLKKAIFSGTNKTLKNRRNKKFITGNTLYHSYVSKNCKNIDYVQNLLSEIEISQIVLNDKNIQYLIADCAIKLLLKKAKQVSNNPSLIFPDFLNNFLHIQHQVLIDDFINDKNDALSFYNNNKDLFKYDYIYEKDEDILGLLYISCKNIGNRKITGTYYTPTKIVRKLISSLSLKDYPAILDPCCGTGNFLLQLPDNISFENIFGNDIDSISVKITRINMSMKFPNISTQKIINHISEKDFLTDYSKSGFTHIIGNPPWGYDFDEATKNKLRKNFNSASHTNIESYDVFIEHSLSILNHNGEVSFVLPEALLNVKAHSEIRNIILNQTNIREICYLGNAFDGVQCPCIILKLENTKQKLSTKGIIIENGKERFIIDNERSVSSNYFSFTTNNQEYSIIQKIKNRPNCTFLSENTTFALGIVTGNNKEYISNVKTSENEVILKGSDIKKYRICPSDNFITFRPENFQQVAPIQIYRAEEKLLYRFISNHLIFAYDDKQTLSLNSCNIVIPEIKGLNIKYIMAILNSRVAQFLFKKEFNSIKILRSHIESIPIPIISEKQQKYIIDCVDAISKETNSKTILSTYEEIDSTVNSLFNLTEKEQTIIKNSIDEENKFLI